MTPDLITTSDGTQTVRVGDLIRHLYRYHDHDEIKIMVDSSKYVTFDKTISTEIDGKRVLIFDADTEFSSEKG